MVAYPLRAAALAAAAMIGLSGCGYNGLYSGVSVGMGNGYYDPYYGGYGYGGYSRLGYGYGYPYYGWYDGFYYPGTGYYIYDRYRRPHRWSDRHRRYWESRRERSLAEGFRNIGANWSGFDQTSTTATRQIERSVDSPIVVNRGDRPSRIERREGRSERNAVRLERQSTRAERNTVRSERSTTRSERSSARSENRSDRSSGSNGRGRDDNRER